jgi:hypothetical protein
VLCEPGRNRDTHCSFRGSVGVPNGSDQLVDDPFNLLGGCDGGFPLCGDFVSTRTALEQRGA